MGDINKQKVIDLLNSATKKEKEATKEPNISISSGNNSNISNTAIYQNCTIVQKTDKAKSTKRKYPDGTIGSNGKIIDNINGLINEIIEARSASKPNVPVGDISKVFYRTFNKHFGIKTKSAIFDFPEERATEIIEYLNMQFNKTITGRIKNAAKKKDYTHSVGHFHRIENEILEKLGKTSHDTDLVDLRFRLFNVTSRKELTLAEWKIYIDELNKKLDNLLK